MADCICCGGKTSKSCVILLSEGVERTVSRCERCGTAFCDPVPSVEEIARCYPITYYGDFLSQHWKNFYKGFRIGRELKKRSPSGLFIDVGCSIGSMAAGVRAASGWQVTGTECSAEVAGLAGELNGVAVIPTASGLLPFADAYADCVFVNNVIEHLPDPAHTIREIRRVLKPGGRLLLTLPNGPVDILPNELSWRRSGTPARTRHSGHIFWFSREGIARLLSENGFAVESCRNFHFKDAAKCRGWIPRPARKKLSGGGSVSPAPQPKLTRESFPPAPSQLVDDLRAAWRGLWRFQKLECGADFQIEAVRR